MTHQIETKLIRTQTDQSCHREHSVPLYMTSSFTFENAEQARAMFAKEEGGFIYTRYDNPNVDEFVNKMCQLEGAEDGVPVASGMSAVFTALAGLLSQGDHVLACRSVFGSTHQILTQILPKWGISHSYADIHRPETWAELVQPNTKMCVVETPSNPALDLIDLEWLGNFCNKRGIILLVDNVFATPLNQTPLAFGAHLVMHSTTKFIDGQGRGIGGILVGDQKYIDDIRFFARHSGPAMSPFNAWMFSKSLETLCVRMKRHCDNAERLAQYLADHPAVNFVKYPHHPSHPQYELAKKQMRRGGGLVTFELAGGLEQGRAFLDSLEMCSLSANLGDTRTIATHPASTTHASVGEEGRLAVGITNGMVRISVGLEHSDDIARDVEQALERSQLAVKGHSLAHT
ncbi:MAG: aminotransferase class I/II-fold pyridoxal phosphate-dependent enzyme [Chloroflexota bacterium]